MGNDLYRSTADKVDGWVSSPTPPLGREWRRATFYEEVWYLLFKPRFNLAELILLLVSSLVAVALPIPFPGSIVFFVVVWLIFGLVRDYTKP